MKVLPKILPKILPKVSDSLNADILAISNTFPNSMALAWSSATWSYSLVGNAPDWSYIDYLYGDDGELQEGPSGEIIPAVYNGLGLLGAPSWKQLLQNSGFVGAEVGGPGEQATNWSCFGVEGARIAVDGESITYKTTGGISRIVDFQELTISAETDYWAYVDIDVAIASEIRQYIHWANIPTGSTITYYLDGILVDFSDNVPVGEHTIAAKLAVGSTAGTAQVRFGSGTASVADGEATITKPQVTENYRYEYIKSPENSTATQPSTAGSASDNGFYWSMWERLKNCFQASSPLTICTVCTMGVGSDELTLGQIESIITPSEDEDTGLFYGENATGTYIAFSDGTNTSYLYTTWSRNDQLAVFGRTLTSETQIQVGVINITDSETTITDGTAVSYAGTFTPVDDLRPFFDVDAPEFILAGYTASEAYSDADCIRWANQCLRGTGVSI